MPEHELGRELQPELQPSAVLASPQEPTWARRNRVGLLTAFVVLANVVGNLALSWGMKHPLGWRPFEVPAIDDLLNPFVLMGILLLAAWTLSRITLLSWADLSYVLPVCSIGYVLNALIGHFLLHEQISAARWLGTALILGGTVLTGLTPPRSEASSTRRPTT